MKLKNFKLVFLLLLVAACKDSNVIESTLQSMPLTSIEKNYNKKNLQVFVTAKDTDLRLTKISEQTFTTRVQPLETEIAIFVNPNKTFQEYLGIGGAITDASSEVFSALNETQQNKLLNSLYGKDGIGYNIIRTSIHSSDFGLGSHTYIEEGDSDLKTFSIEKDMKKKNSFYKKSYKLN